MNEKPIQLAIAMIKNELVQVATRNLLKASQNKNNFFLMNDKKLAILSLSKCLKKFLTDEITLNIFLELVNKGKIKIINGISKENANTICFPVEYILTLNTIENLKKNVSNHITFNENKDLLFQ